METSKCLHSIDEQCALCDGVTVTKRAACCETWCLDPHCLEYGCEEQEKSVAVFGRTKV